MSQHGKLDVRRRPAFKRSQRRLLHQTLEARTLLAANPVGEQFLVAESAGIETGAPATAFINDGGDFVVAWESYEEGDDYLGFGIYTQTYDQSGSPLGDPVLANEANIVSDQLAPAIASDGDGNILVAWQSKHNEENGFDIRARWFVAGTWGDEFLVNSFTAGDQTHPTVGMDHNGYAVIAWQSEGQDDDGLGIYARRYSIGYGSGSFLAADEFRVNVTEAGNQTTPSVAVSQATGQFVVTWEGEDLSGDEASIEVYARRFADDGTPVDLADLQVNSTTLRDQVTPKTAIDSSGNFVVTWVSEGIAGSGSDVFGQRFDSSGTMAGSEFVVNTTTDASQVSPAVGMNATGDFVVTWQSVHLDGFSWGIYAHEYYADGSTVTGREEFRVNNHVMGPQTHAAVAVRPDGDALVAWVGNDVNHVPAVHAKAFELGGLEVPPGDVPDLVLANFVALEDTPPDAAMDASGNSVVVWQSYGEDGDGFGVYALKLDIDGEPLIDPFLVNVGQELGNQSDPAVAANADGEFVVVWHADDLIAAGHDVYGQRYDDSGNPVGPRILVNETTEGDQSQPAVAMADDGSFVVTWQGPDDSGLGAYGRRYDANGEALGGEFQLNQQTALDQFSTTVAMNATGQFVAAWVSDHPSLTDPENDPEKSVFVQWYDESGNSVGEEVIAHEFVKDAQEHPDVGIDAEGRFVVTWQSINQEGMMGASWGVYGRQFDTNKQPLSPTEFHVNEMTTGPQRYSTVGVDADGNFVIAWQSNSHEQSGNSWELFLRQYDDNGAPLRGEEAVNNWSQGPQINPIVARASTGDFGVFWSGQGAAHTEGIHGRLYSSSEPDPIPGPSRLPGEDQFLVGETFSLEGSAPDIGVDDSGKFMTTWESFEEDGSGWGVYAQQYAADGTPLASAFQVNSFVDGDQHAPAIASDASGNSLIVWQSFGQDGDGYGIFGQWFGATGTAVGDEFLINVETIEGDQVSPDVVMMNTATSSVALVVWQTADGEGGDIHAKWFAEIGDTTGGSEFLVNTLEAGAQVAPSIAAADASQRAIIVWQGPAVVEEGEEGEEASLEIYGQRLKLNETVGESLFVQEGDEFVVNSILDHDQVNPAVAMQSDGGFVVAFVAEGQAASGSDVYARRFNVSGTALGSDTLVHTEIARPQRGPAIGMDDEGNYLITWQSSHQDPDEFAWGVFGRQFTADGTPLQTEFLVNSLTSGPQTGAAVTVNDAGAAVVAWVGLDSTFHPAIHGKLLTVPVSDPDSPELILANYLAPEESPPAAGMDAEGNSIVVWQSYREDGSGLGIFGQRVTSTGAADGDRFVINTFTEGNQSEPDIAVNRLGQSVVVWQSEDQDGDGYGIYAQRYLADGTPDGDEFQVNRVTEGDQSLPTVAIDDRGAFIVAWQSPDADGLGIYARRFDETGTPVDDTEFGMNTETALDQFGADVAMNGSGQAVISWVSDHPAALPDSLDTEKSVFLRSVGTPSGPEILVHRFVKDAQEHPAVAIGDDGRVVVIWQSINQDGNTWGVMARTFNADLQPEQRREFIVNETRQGPQRYASVAIDELGRFVVAWQSDSRLQAGSSWEIYSQQYNAAVRPEGGEQLVNTWTDGPQIHPVLAQAPDGRFGVYWIGIGDDHLEGVHGRLYTPLDYGDAPTAAQSGFDSDYPVTLAQDGARHVPGPLFLGLGVDREPDGLPSTTAGQDGIGGDDQDGTDDEDGVQVISSLVTTAVFDTTSSFLVTASQDGKLDAWIDFNRDGDWLDAGEQLFVTSVDVVTGANVITFTIPAGSSLGQTYARFRLSSVGALQPTGAADDGEVEDYRFTIANGDGNVPIVIGLDVGQVEVTAEGNEVVGRHHGIELLRAPGATVASLTFEGTDGNDQVRLGRLTGALPNPIPLIFHGGSGRDRLTFTDSDQWLDLTNRDLNQLFEIEEIDIIGASPNQLTLDEQSVMDATDSSNTLLVIHDDDDSVDYVGDHWAVGEPIFVNGGQRHVLTSGTARVECVNTLPFQNPLVYTDVNRIDGTTANDALIVINFFQRSGNSSGDLPTPSNESELPEAYYDVNGSRTATALDALIIINHIDRQLLKLSAPEQEWIPDLSWASQPVVSQARVTGLEVNADTSFAELHHLGLEVVDSALLEFLDTVGRPVFSVYPESPLPVAGDHAEVTVDDEVTWTLAFEELIAGDDFVTQRKSG